MTGREALFLLLGFIIGILATEVFQFLKGFVLWTRNEKAQVIQQIDLAKTEKQGASSFRIDTDENGNVHIVRIEKETEENGKDGVHRTTDISNDNNGDTE